MSTARGDRRFRKRNRWVFEFADLLGDSSPNLLTFLEVDPVNEQRPASGEKQVDTDELYEPGPLENTPRVPVFSRREKFVTEVVREHPRVARALVNRVWALLMGRGIVHPYDEMDSMHEASHPQLLDWLSQDFRKSGYDVRRLVRGIVSSEAYQLNSRRPDGVEDPASFAITWNDSPLNSLPAPHRSLYWRNRHRIAALVPKTFRICFPMSR